MLPTGCARNNHSLLRLSTSSGVCIQLIETYKNQHLVCIGTVRVILFSHLIFGKDQLPGKSNHGFKNLGNSSKPVKPKPEAIPSLTSDSYGCPSMSTSVVISRRDLDRGYHMLQKRAFQMALSLSHVIPLKLRPNHIKMIRIQMRIVIYTKENLLARYDKN